MSRAPILALAAVLPLLAAAPATSVADQMKGDAMKGGMISAGCKNADATMMKMAHSDDAMMPKKMSGDADKDFAKMAMVNQSNLMAMAKVEAKCGKNDASRAAAQKMVDRLNQIEADLELILHTP
jgi:hypothetical protein